MADDEKAEYVIATAEVDPDALRKLDTKCSSREKDGLTIQIPSQSNNCAPQLWEVYLAVAVLLVQPQSEMMKRHITALCTHEEATHLCEAVLNEHLANSNVTDMSQEVSLVSFFEDYYRKKFNVAFSPGTLHQFITENFDDPLCGTEDVPRTFLVAPFVQAFFLGSQFFEAQYDELIDAMRMGNLPVNDVLKEADDDIGDTVEIEWDNTKLYDDPTLILKKYGGWAVTKTSQMLTKKDQLVMRLTGCTLDQLLAGKQVPDSPRDGGDYADKRQGADDLSGHSDIKDDTSEASSHPSDYQVDPEHPRIVPFGLSLCEMYVLLRGIFKGQDGAKGDWKGSVVGQQVAAHYKDGRILAGVVLVDLYMREQIDVHHWTLQEGNVAVPYHVCKRAGHQKMDHFLDTYVPLASMIFDDMLIPAHIGETPIWASLERRGIIDNHRTSWESAYGLGFRNVDIWDLVRPDLLLDLKEGYLLAARVLYDKSFEGVMEQEPNDALMFCYLLQYAFDNSLDTLDAMAKVLERRCPPFQKGELFPPIHMVHSGSVCIGLLDRGFRCATGQDNTLAQEAAEFNEATMLRLEERFFLSPKLFEAFDADQSGELTKEEFVEGMRSLDLYRDFRRERVPEEVLRTIIGDLAERLFHEVDVDMDGTLKLEEIAIAFKHRRKEAFKAAAKKQWAGRMVQSAAASMGLAKKLQLVRTDITDAVEEEANTRRLAKMMEHRQRMEWSSELEKLEFLDEEVDIDTGLSVH